jgi:hypothetical protein
VAGETLQKFKGFPTGGRDMRYHSIATPRNEWQHSFEDLKRYLASHEDLFDNIFEKIMETGTIIMVAVLSYMVILIMDALNHANQAYADGLSCLLFNPLQNLIHSALKIFM